MTDVLNIADMPIMRGCAPFIVSETSGNHHGVFNSHRRNNIVLYTYLMRFCPSDFLSRRAGRLFESCTNPYARLRDLLHPQRDVHLD